MTRRFATSAAPHAAASLAVPVVMRRVLYALIPAACAHVWFFGIGLLINLAVATGAAILTEAICQRCRHQQTTISDGSAIVTASLLSLSLPPLTPFWIPLIGAVVAIAVAKHLYGGLGRNLFNPAMVAYVLLLVSFPVEMTQWVPPRMGDLDYQHLDAFATVGYSLTGALPDALTLDALTRATPLDIVKEGLRGMQTVGEASSSSLFGDFGGRGWEWVGNMLLIGGLYLLYTGTIRWHIPAGVLGGLLLPAAALYLLDPSRFASPAFHLFSGATLIGAFFIATDPVTAAASRSGRLIFGAGIGILTFAIRVWGGYPDGVAFAVLLMNAAVPALDNYTRPRVYGHD